MRLSRAMGIPSAVVLMFLVGTSRGGDAVESGLKVGDLAGPFTVDDITGPYKGTSLCYR